MKKQRGSMEEISVGTELFHRINDALTQAKKASVKDAPSIVIKVLGAIAQYDKQMTVLKLRAHTGEEKGSHG